MSSCKAWSRFFDAPELRKYYAGLIEDCSCELRLREIAKEEESCEST